MIQNKDAWKRFEETGNVLDYITYVNAKHPTSIDTQANEGMLPDESHKNYTDSGPRHSTIS